VVILVWSFSPAWEAVELTPLAWRAPRWRGGRHDGAEGAISTKQYTCLHLTVNEAICLSGTVDGMRVTVWDEEVEGVREWNRGPCRREEAGRPRENPEKDEDKKSTRRAKAAKTRARPTSFIEKWRGPPGGVGISKQEGQQ
jgi:hypothetical protein